MQTVPIEPREDTSEALMFHYTVHTLINRFAHHDSEARSIYRFDRSHSRERTCRC